MLRPFYNVCRHRGNRLALTEQGCFPRSIQCSYYGWTSNLDGELIATPNVSKLEGFNRQQWGLQTVAVATWEGFLFVNLGREDEREPLPTQITRPDSGLGVSR